ncbi:hypothetical protein [Massilia sp.]|uniref:hypothetical protein n=1 Tax=Massilia sp. TaxID=1882437 RepID=UPI00352F390D
MLTAESTLAKKFVNLLFYGAAAIATTGYVFWTELTDAVTDQLTDRGAVVKRRWDPGLGGQLSLRPERNDTGFLQVSGLKSGARTPFGIPVSFDLTNQGAANDFPNVAVVMVNTSGQALRQILFSPKDYSHGTRFEKEHVELLLQPRGEERSFTVRVFYGERP